MRPRSSTADVIAPLALLLAFIVACAAQLLANFKDHVAQQADNMGKQVEGMVNAFTSMFARPGNKRD